MKYVDSFKLLSSPNIDIIDKKTTTKANIAYDFLSTRTKKRTLPFLRQTELKKLSKNYTKMKSVQKAQYEVAIYHNQIAVLTSIHKTCEEKIDWHNIADSQPPFINEMGPKERIALNAKHYYKPNLFDKWFNRTAKKQERLTQAVLNAKREDEQDYLVWYKKVELAKQILKLESKSYLQALRELNLFDDIRDIGSEFEFFVYEKINILAIQFQVNGVNSIPSIEKKMTKTGKLSLKEMTKTKYYGLYQDYICSCIIRIARDAFAILPIEEVLIHAIDEVENSSTGYTEKQTLLSVRIQRATLNRLNFDKIDCSDAILQFEHNMNFMKTRGFKPVTQLAIQ